MRLALACNDYRNGAFQGWAESAYVHLGESYDEGLEIEGPRVKVSDSGTELRVGRVAIPVTDSQEWVGNWCWNEYGIDLASMIDILTYLRGRGWRCTCGPTELFDKFNVTGDLTPLEWRRLLGGDERRPPLTRPCPIR